MTTVWDNWSECKEIDHQKGVRKRLGRCRLQPNTIKNNYDYNFGVSAAKTEKVMFENTVNIFPLFLKFSVKTSGHFW